MVETPKFLMFIIVNITMVDWLRSPEEGCVNRLYGKPLQLNRVKK